MAQSTRTMSSSTRSGTGSSSTTGSSNSNPYLDPSLLMFGDLSISGKDDKFLKDHHYDALKSVDRDVTRNNNNSNNYDSFNPYLRGIPSSSITSSITSSNINSTSNDEDCKQQQSRPSEFDNYLQQQKAKNDAYLQKLSQRLSKSNDKNNDNDDSPTSSNTQNSGSINKLRNKGYKSKNKNKFERTVVLEPLSSYQNKKLAKMKQIGQEITTNVEPINGTLNTVSTTKNVRVSSISKDTQQKKQRPERRINNGKDNVNFDKKHKKKKDMRKSKKLIETNNNNANDKINTAVSPVQVLDHQYGTRSRQSQ